LIKTLLRVWGPGIVLGLMIVAYALTFGVVSVRQHDALRTHVFDLGNVDQTVWNTIHGRPMHFTTQPDVGENRLGMHVEPILFGVSLTYLVYPDPRGLLVLQTVALALGAIPLYALARRRLGARWTALAFPFAYLMLPALQSANLFEFHAVTLSPPLLFAAFYFLDRAVPPAGSATPGYGTRRDWTRYGLFLFLAMTCKEDISLLVVLLGLYVIVFRRRPLAGALTSIAGFAWFVIAVYVVLPHFRPAGSPFLDYYQGLGQNPVAIAWTLLTQPKALQTYILTPENALAVRALLLPLAGLPIFGLPFALLAAPSFGISFVSSNPLLHRMERYHYAAPMVAAMFVAGVYGLGGLSSVLGGRRKARRRWPGAALALLVVAASVGYGYERGFSPLARQSYWPAITAHERLIDQVARVVPPAAVASFQATLFPHFSQRETAYFWPDPRPKDYIVLDVSDPTFWNSTSAHEALQRQLDTDPEFGPIYANDGFLVLKKGAPQEPLPAEFYTFAKVDRPVIRYPMTIDFGDIVRFLGFTPIYDREEEVRYELYFQPLRPIDRNLTVSLYLVDAAGKVVGGTDRTQPVLVWYPTSRWQTGETIRVLANSLNWWTGDRTEYAVALGLADGSDIWNVGLRLRPAVGDSKWVTPLLADGSLVQLMRFRREWELHYSVETPRQFTAPAIGHQVGAHFGDQGEGAARAALVGYDLPQARLKRGDSLDLSLVWQSLAARSWDVSYTVFLHVTGPNGAIVAQQDALPGEGGLGRWPTTSWMPGEYVTDRHQVPLPSDLPAGRYNVVVGLYRLDTGARLSVQGDGAQGDQIVLDQELEITN
jgi:uncharacterized membrane protein